MSECAATPHDKLIAEICDSRVAKTEREHAAGREIERLRAERDALAEALRRLEVTANTVGYCYNNRPENFASALRMLADDAEAARAALAKLEGKR